MFLRSENYGENTEPRIWKRLFSVFLVSALLGSYLFLFSLILSTFFMVVGVVGLMFLTWNRWKMLLGRYSWLYLISLKRRGKLPENLKQEKMPSWILTWLICTSFTFLLALFLLESEMWYVSFLLFYSWITTVVLLVFYLSVIRD